MSLPQVAKVMSLPTAEDDCSRDVCHLKAPYSSGQFSFTASFSFEQTKLTRVALLLKNNEAGDALVAALKAKYGAPFDQNRDSVSETLSWRASGDIISISWITVSTPHQFVIEYQPIISADGKGL
jgi:hypothetical protein